MSNEAENSSETALSAEEISLMRELIRKQVEGRVQLPGWGISGMPYHVVTAPATQSPLTFTPEEYVQIIDSRGEIVNISIKTIEEKLTKVVQSIVGVAQSAADAGMNIAKKIGKGPFELDEITVGISIKIEAGVIVFGVGGDTSLELKFVRMKPTSSTTA